MKIFCIGRNYADHAKELNNPLPESPVVFMKPPTALLKGGKAFFKPEFSDDIHYEAELVIRISKNGKHIAEKFAHKYYDQLSLGIDFTARDLQAKLKEKKQPWELAKAFDNSAVIGEMIGWESLANKENIVFELKKNGEVVQSGHSHDMIFSFDYCISYISQYFTLQQGDLIYTGTPAGVGSIGIGDELEGSVEGRPLLRCEVR